MSCESWCVSRKPTARELQVASDYIARQTKAYADRPEYPTLRPQLPSQFYRMA